VNCLESPAIGINVALGPTVARELTADNAQVLKGVAGVWPLSLPAQSGFLIEATETLGELAAERSNDAQPSDTNVPDGSIAPLTVRR
jgi:hypothetical protein